MSEYFVNSTSLDNWWYLTHLFCDIESVSSHWNLNLLSNVIVVAVVESDGMAKTFSRRGSWSFLKDSDNNAVSIPARRSLITSGFELRSFLEGYQSRSVKMMKQWQIWDIFKVHACGKGQVYTMYNYIFSYKTAWVNIEVYLFEYCLFW